MDNADRRVLCSICGKEIDIFETFDICTGRRTQHLCAKCYKSGQTDVAGYELRKTYRKMKEWSP